MWGTSRVVGIFAVLILLSPQVSGQKLPSKDFVSGLLLINKGLELKNLWQRLERDFQNERDIVKATKIKQDAADVQKKSRAAFLQAVAAFKAAVNADPTSFSAHYYLGWAFNELEQYSKAIVPLDNARQLKPRDSSINFELGWAYDRMGQFERAADLFEIAANLKSDYSEAWFELGWTNEKMKQYQKAVESYKQVINLKPDDARAYYNLALVYLKLGNKSAAIEQQITLKTLDPNLANSLNAAINK